MSRFTAGQIEFLRAGYQHWKAEDLAAFFNAWFGTEKTPGQIATALKNHRIVCGRKGNDRLIRRRRLLSPEQERYLCEQYLLLPLAELTVAFNAAFNLRISEHQIRCYIHNHGIRSGRRGTFKKGNLPWNTGTKGKTGRNKTSFVKGNVPVTIKPLYHERPGKDGYVEIKVPEKNPYTGHKTRYRMKHVWLWEQEHGPVPRGMAVYFKDSDKMNFAIDNLGLVSRKELLAMNLHNYKEMPMELKPSVLALAKLEAKAGVRSKPGRGRKKQNEVME